MRTSLQRMAYAPGSFLSRKVFAPQKLNRTPQTEEAKIYARFLHPACVQTCEYMRKALGRLILIIVIFTMVEENFEISCP